MRRREFIGLVGSAAAAWPLSARAQQPLRRLGVLLGLAENNREAQAWFAALRDELAKLGWTEGRNIEIKFRASGDVEMLKRLAKELVALQPDLILTGTTPAGAAMLQQTRTIPIVFVLVADPVGSGFIATLSHPGGNATGFTPIVSSLGGKWVELLKEIAPRMTRVTASFNPPTATWAEDYLSAFKAAAAALNMEAIIAPVADMDELYHVIKQAAEQNSGLVVIPDTFAQGHRAEITDLAARYRVPAIYWSRSYTELGGLISYGPYIVEEYRRAASYVDRILKGEKPSNLPVQAPVKYEFTINLKAARALGLDVPLVLQQRADEMIE
jgi:putative ABC transport system substrate-binding protein